MNSRRGFLGQLLMAAPATAAAIAIAREQPLVEGSDHKPQPTRRGVADPAGPSHIPSMCMLVESVANRFWDRHPQRHTALLVPRGVLFYQCEMVRGQDELDVAINKLVEETKDATEFGKPVPEENNGLWEGETEATHRNVNLTRLESKADPGGEPFYFVAVAALGLPSDTYADRRQSIYKHDLCNSDSGNVQWYINTDGRVEIIGLLLRKHVKHLDGIKWHGFENPFRKKWTCDYTHKNTVALRQM